VKAKSFNPQDENIFIGKMAALSVMETLFIWFFPEIRGTENLPSIQVWGLFIDGRQNKKASSDGLNQMFRIPKMEIQERILSKSTFFEGDWQFGFIRNECGWYYRWHYLQQI
jgi:hypothetical protein